MSWDDLVDVPKKYTFPKLTGDWDDSASSGLPSDSGSEDFSSHDSVARKSDWEGSTASSEEAGRQYSSLFGRRYKQKYNLDNNPFIYQSFTKCLKSESCIGPNSDYVILLSSDGQAFVVKRRYAYVSKVLHMYFNRTCPSGINIWDLHFRLPSLVVHWVCLYLIYKYTYTKYEGCLDVPEFSIPPKIAFDMIMAGYMLQC